MDVPKITVELAVSSDEAGSSGSGERNTTNRAAAAVEVLVGEARPLGSHSTVPKSKGLLVKLNLFGPEQTAQKLLVKVRLLDSQSRVP